MHKLCTISKCVASHKLGWYDLKSFLGYSGMSTLLASLCLVTGCEMHVDWMLANLASWLLVLTCSWYRGYVILGLWMLHSPWLRTWRAWNATMGRREHTKHSNTSSSNIETPEVTLVYDLTIFMHCSWCGELTLACLKNQLPNQMRMTPQYFLCPFANRVLFVWVDRWTVC